MGPTTKRRRAKGRPLTAPEPRLRSEIHNLLQKDETRLLETALGTIGGEKKAPPGGETMLKKTDVRSASLRPLLDKTLENALAYRIAKEFPRIGGPRIRKLCAEMVLEVVHRHIRAKDCVQHGQILWTIS